MMVNESLTILSWPRGGLETIIVCVGHRLTGSTSYVAQWSGQRIWLCQSRSHVSNQYRPATPQYSSIQQGQTIDLVAVWMLGLLRSFCIAVQRYFVGSINDVVVLVLFPFFHTSGAVWESRWPSWAVRPNEPSGFRGRKAILNHASALVSACP